MLGKVNIRYKMVRVIPSPVVNLYGPRFNPPHVQEEALQYSGL
jgi:hypothetical protein